MAIFLIQDSAVLTLFPIAKAMHSIQIRESFNLNFQSVYTADFLNMKQPIDPINTHWHPHTDVGSILIELFCILVVRA